MASKQVPSTVGRMIAQGARPSNSIIAANGRRAASSSAAPAKEQNGDLEDLVSYSSLGAKGHDQKEIAAYNPAKRASSRRQQLPRSRYDTPSVQRLKSLLTLPLDTSISLRVTTADHCTHINHHQSPIQPPVNSFQDLSPPHALPKHGSPLWHPIS